MKYFLDEEFSAPGSKFKTELISLAVISEDGREFYRVSSEFDEDSCNDFVKTFVLPKLAGERRVSCMQIMRELFSFIGNDPRAQFIGYHSSTDWHILCLLMKEAGGLPCKYQKYCYDIAQLHTDLGCPRLPPKPSANDRHHALADARWCKQAYEFLSEILNKATALNSDRKI